MTRQLLHRGLISRRDFGPNFFGQTRVPGKTARETPMVGFIARDNAKITRAAGAGINRYRKYRARDYILLLLLLLLLLFLKFPLNLKREERRTRSARTGEKFMRSGLLIKDELSSRDWS